MKRALLMTALLSVLAGCGGGEKEKSVSIPTASADALTKQLAQVEDAVDKGRCGSATFQVEELTSKVDSLADDVTAKTQLSDGVARLGELVDGECEEPTDTETTKTETIPTETLPTETQPTETQPTETQPTETQPTETTPTETVPDNGGTPPGNGPDGNGPPGQTEQPRGTNG